jgi:two-component sensor histidine kinase
MSRATGVWPALAVLVAALGTTAHATRVAHRDARAAALVEVRFAAEEVRHKVEVRLERQQDILRSGAAFIDASDEVTRAAWRTFVTHQDIAGRLRGVLGIGWAVRFGREELGRHEAAIRAEGFPDYRVRPEGDREACSAVVFLEPFEGRNLRAFGFDMLSESVRREALGRATDTGAPALSGKVVLVQETAHDVQAGTLMYVPVYRRGQPVSTVEERRAALLGWVYSPHRMRDLMHGILGGWEGLADKRMHLEVYDGTTPSPASLLYDTHPDAAVDMTGGLAVQSTVTFAGRPWTLLFAPADPRHLDLGRTWLVLGGGGSVSLLLAALTLAVLRTRWSARRLARAMTVEMRRSLGALTEARDALQGAVDEKEALIKEVHHRVKNNLQVMISLLSLQSAQVSDARSAGALQDAAERIRTMALVHEHLYGSRDLARVDLAEFLRELTSGLLGVFGRREGLAVEVRADDVRLGVDAAIPMGLITSELVTNALKYAFPDGRAGRVIVAVAAEPAAEGTRAITLSVSDDGVGLPADLDPEKTPTLGLRLVYILAKQLGGTVQLDREGGARFAVRFRERS